MRVRLIVTQIAGGLNIQQVEYDDNRRDCISVESYSRKNRSWQGRGNSNQRYDGFVHILRKIMANHADPVS